MNRMNLSQLVSFFDNELYLSNCSRYFASLANDSVTVDGLIEADFVKRHCTIGLEDTKVWREIQANVTTYIGCEK
jgi:hypothetical protein